MAKISGHALRPRALISNMLELLMTASNLCRVWQFSTPWSRRAYFLFLLHKRFETGKQPENMELAHLSDVCFYINLNEEHGRFNSLMCYFFFQQWRHATSLA